MLREFVSGVCALFAAGCALLRRCLVGRKLDTVDEGDSILLICRRPADLDVVGQLPATASVVVASDEADTRQAAREHPQVANLSYVESMTTELDISDDVIRVRDRINEWLASLHDGEDKYSDTVFWRCVPEGGDIQRIVDSILLIESIKKLLAEVNPDTVVLPQRLRTRFDDRVVRATVHTTEVQIVTVNPLPAELLGVVGRAPSSYYYARHKRFPLPVWTLWLARSIQFFNEMVRARWKQISPWFNTRIQPLDPNKKSIVQHHRGSDRKHCKDTSAILPEFEDIPGYEAHAITWREETGRAKLSKNGISTIPLERTVPVMTVSNAICEAYQLWQQASAHQEELAEAAELRYDGVELAPVLWPIIRRYFRLYLPDRLCLWTAATRYFRSNTVEVIKFAGAGYYVPEGIIARRATMRVTTPFVFTFRRSPRHLSTPYPRVANPVCDRYFAAGHLERQRYREENVPNDRITEVGALKFDNIQTGISDVSPTESLKSLGADTNDNGLTVYFASQPSRRGSVTTRERTMVTTALFECAVENDALQLLAKPHPKEPRLLLEQIHETYSSDNAQIVSSSKDPLHCINAADVVVTKASTTGIEAFPMDTPVISVALDANHHFVRYGDAAEKIRSTGPLKQHLTELTTDKRKRSRWSQQQQAKIRAFVSRNLHVPGSPTEKIVSEIVDAVEERAATPDTELSPAYPDSGY